MQLITIDFETYWAKDFSLRSKDLNMSEYVLDDRFSIHMMGIKINDGPVKVVPGDRVREELDKIDWSKSALLCQNTAFDGFILSQHFNVVPAFYYDTLSMGRGAFSVAYPLDLDSLAKYCGFTGKPKKDSFLKTKGVRELPADLWGEVASYCADDVNETWNVFQHLVADYPTDELELIDLTIRMFCEPVLRVDLKRVQTALEAEMGKKVAALFKADVTADDLLSNQKFAELLKRKGLQSIPMKTSMITGNPTFAFAKTDYWMMENREHPVFGPIIQARLAIKSTIGETRAERLLNVGDRPLPVMLNYCGAHTGRWSAGNKMNLQNLPRGGELRKSILAPEGFSVVVCDSAQIEARVLAWIAEHTVLLDLFRAGSDVYKWMAAQVYNKAISDITKDERFIGKVCTLGLGYGMGPPKLQETLAKGALGAPPLKVSGHQAQDWVDAYRYTNAPIVDFWEKCNDVLQRMAAGTEMPFGPMEITKNALLLPNGLALHYPELGVREEKRRRGYHYRNRNLWSPIYGGLLTENCIAGGTEVLTDRGWKPIERITRNDLVHDGVEFVPHGGTLAKSVQPCVIVDGVYMTPDHEVLTNEGWKAASQSPRPYRPYIRESDGDQSQHSVRTGKSQLEQGDAGVAPVRIAAHKEVYDILNAGPRQRFVVRGREGPFIVHNCVQALARCIVAEQMLRISKFFRVVTMTHDEVVCVAPTAQADACLELMIGEMKTPPRWAPDLPLGAEGGHDVMYSK